MVGQVWEIVGGGKQGGIVVRTEKGTTSPEHTSRLSTGALVRELELDGERLQYRLLSGEGPGSGWVSVKFKTTDLAIKSDKQAPLICWKVVGGGSKGGVLVREGNGTASLELPKRLATGAFVRELDLQGERLQYQKLLGAGPSIGWVSIKLKDNDLLVHADAPAIATPMPPTIPLDLVATVRPFAVFGKPLPEGFDINGREPGEHFGIHFPFTAEQIEEAGVEWLTQAFHLAGTLPKDNKVAKLVSMKTFLGGGASVKVILNVEYATPSDDLHTQLFVKMPLDPSHKNRMANIYMNMEGSELIFNRFLSKSLPFRSAKYYFGDISMKTSNWILINEKLNFSEAAQEPIRLPANVIEPANRKCFDFQMYDALGNYMALIRNAAKLAAWAATGRLGDQLEAFYPMVKQTLVTFGVQTKQVDGFWPNVEEWVLKCTGERFFPSDIANPDFMESFKEEIKEVGLGLNTVNKYVQKGGDVWGFNHPNLHVDNAYFFSDEGHEKDCGMLDYAGTSHFFILNIFVSGGGILPMATAEMRVEHQNEFVRCFFETLHEHGGHLADVEDMCVRVALMDMAYLIGMFKLIGTNKMGDIYDEVPKEQWASLSGMEDPALAANTIPALMARSATNMLMEGIKTWKGAKYIETFKKWRLANPK